MIQVGDHTLKTWSSTQTSITLSSAEAELVAAVKASTELLGIAQLASDWGIKYECGLYVDASAAIGVMQRRGNGKMRHVKVGDLWVQEKIEDGEIKLRKVGGESNPADLMTKHLNGTKIEKHMETIGQESRDGRAEKSLELT